MIDNRSSANHTEQADFEITGRVTVGGVILHFGSQNIVETILAVEQALRQGTHVNRKKLTPIFI